MADQKRELRIGTAPDGDGTVRLGFSSGETKLGEKIADQDELASFASHLLNSAGQAQKGQHALPKGGAYTVFPTAISLATSGETNQLLVVLWFGQGGVSFPIDPAQAKQMFKAVADAAETIKKH